MDFTELEKTAKTVNAVMPTISLMLDAWYQQLQAAVKATNSFARIIERVIHEENMALANWEGEGGAL